MAGESEFGRADMPFIDTRIGIWMVHRKPTIYMTTVGLTTDPDARITTGDGSVIPGLYAAGDVCGSLEEKDGAGYQFGFFSALARDFHSADTIEADLQTAARTN